MRPPSVQAALDTGFKLIFGGHVNEATAHFEAAVSKHPDSLDLRFALANLLSDTGTAARALPIYQEILAALPSPDNIVLINYGISLYRAGRPGEAVECLERALSQDPASISARVVLQRAMADTGRFVEAYEHGVRILHEKDARALGSADRAAIERMQEHIARIDWGAIDEKPRVIAFSLWGNVHKYLDGMLIACATAARFYPGWTVRVYVDETVPAKTVSMLLNRGAEVITMPTPKNPQAGRFWRFMVADDPRIGRFLCRDCDTPIVPKEANSVAEWVNSRKPFHVMRGHPYHTDLILAGMWGGIAGLLPSLTSKLDMTIASADNPLNPMIDQIFLADHIWPLIRDYTFVHDTPFQFGGPPLPESDVASGAGIAAPLEWDYCRHGIMVWLKHDVGIGKSLREYGEWSEAEVALLTQYIARDDFIIEGGSNVGTHTLALARATGPDGKVIAFEPQPDIFRLLEYNVGINGISNVDARQCALGSISGRTSISVPDYASPQNFGAVSTGHGDHQVKMIAIDDLEISRLSLLKLDVEGRELEALAGAARTIGRFRPTIYVENDRREKVDALIEFIRQMGYRLWWHVPFLYSSENWRQQKANVFPNIASINMLCLPPERPVIAVEQLEPITEGSPNWPKRVA